MCGGSTFGTQPDEEPSNDHDCCGKWQHTHTGRGIQGPHFAGTATGGLTWSGGNRAVCDNPEDGGTHDSLEYGLCDTGHSCSDSCNNAITLV